MHFRVEIIRLSDKSFKETIKDVELSTYRSTSKEGYASMDPTKPLPHEYEEGKLRRYNDNNNLRQKDVAVVNMETVHSANENDPKIWSEFLSTNDSNVILNKTEFREILLNALSNDNNVTSSINLNKFDDNINGSDANGMDDIFNDNANQLNGMNGPEIDISHENVISSTDDTVNSNETIEKTSTAPLIDTTEISTDSITLETPEVDKLLNGGTNKLTIHSDIRKKLWHKKYDGPGIGN